MRQQLPFCITAYADGAPLTAAESAEVTTALQHDPAAIFEFDVQLAVKHAISRKCGRALVAPARRAAILNAAYAQAPAGLGASGLLSFPGWFARAAGIALLVLSTALLYLQYSGTDINTEPHGDDFFDVAAASNFSKILQGSISPQFLSSSPESIRAFFSGTGVEYNTVVPRIEGFSLLGAVVSNERGGKFAHHVYSSAGGKLIYCFQIRRDHITRTRQFLLTQSLLEHLDAGKTFCCGIKGNSCAFREVNGSVIAFVSNTGESELESVINKSLR